MLVDVLPGLLRQLGVAAEWVEPLSNGLSLLLLLGAAKLVHLTAKRRAVDVVKAFVRRSTIKWDDALLRAGVFTRLAHLAPAVLIKLTSDEFFTATGRWTGAFDKCVSIYIVVVVVLVVDALLDAGVDHYNERSGARRVPLRGFAQGGKLVTYLLGMVVILSQMLDRSPVYLLSGLGALTAVLVVLFKDALLGFVAGVQISVNRMVQIGDWIEMVKYGADGEIVDVGLTTVKVQNWDKTITMVPTYALISEPVKNWRGMVESGGRRMKRAIYLDVSSFRFVDPALLEKLSAIRRLAPYLERKLQRNGAPEAGASVLASDLTNVGSFRAYVEAYLREHPGIHQGLTLLVRQLDTTDKGLPIELYAFTCDTSLDGHEAVQADIFDHLLTVVPEFGLRLFQSPAGADVRALASGELGGPSSRTYRRRAEA
jgi:miniconductance mechanosensitive channel